MIDLTLPWWPDELKANAKPHRFVRARKAKAYKAQCFWTAKEQGLGKLVMPGLHLTFTYQPKAHGPAPDLDNCGASSKHLIDAIAQATGIDDKHFTYGEPSIGDRVEGGLVRVRIEPQRSAAA